jgi:UDP-glucuronate 4-epimerase
MKVFLTGVAGFVGSRLAKSLLARGDGVVGLDNMNDYYPIVHKERHLADLTGQRDFTFVQGDLRDAPLLLELFQKHKPDAVAHLAAMAAVRYSVEHPLIYGTINVQGSVNVLDAARQVGQPRCVLASTGSSYGATTPVPFKEDAAADRPLAPYPASKRAMELFAHSYAHLWKIPITCLRFFNVYGPHGRPDMMPWKWAFAIHKGEPITLYNAGRLKRDWTYIDDIVAGFVAAIDNPFAYEVINLGCSNPVENTRFVQILEEILQRKAQSIDTPAPSSEPLITHADISKARRMLGYDPKVTVEDGLARFVNWLREQRLL